MKKPVLIFLLTFAFTWVASAQTTVTIIGTAHEKTAHFNVDSLFNMLVKIRPNVILQELDTDLMDSDGHYKGRALTDKGNEHLASMKYKALNDAVIFRRFDIEDRSYYYASHHTFVLENKLSKSLDSVYNHNLLSDKDRQIIATLFKVNQQLNDLYLSDIATLNSVAYRSLAKSRQDWMYNKQLEVIAHTTELKEYYSFYKDDGEFWIRRNHTMVNNIAHYIKAFKGKRIVVLTGATHKYFLTDGLEPLQTSLHFQLEDLPD